MTLAGRFWPWGPLSMALMWHEEARRGRASHVEKVLAYIGHAQQCQVLAVSAREIEHRAQYLKMAQIWIDLADARNLSLTGSGLTDAQKAPYRNSN
jgi:hypothetical protein